MKNSLASMLAVILLSIALPGISSSGAAPAVDSPVVQTARQMRTRFAFESDFTIRHTIARIIIPHNTKYLDDELLFEDETKLIIEGRDGLILITDEIMSPGTDVRIFTLRSVTEVIAVGTKPLTASRGSFVWPSDGQVISKYGYRKATSGSSNHKGVDIGGVKGQAIVAADGGEVIFSGRDGLFGKVVRIKHDSGDITLYAHCDSLLVEAGERVSQGQEIACLGATGNADGVHLHFELIIDGENVDPMEHMLSRSAG